MAARMVKDANFFVGRCWEVVMKGLLKWDLRDRQEKLEGRIWGGGFEDNEAKRLISILDDWSFGVCV